MSSYSLREHVVVSTVQLELTLATRFTSDEVPLLRGYFGRLFPDHTEAHNHGSEEVIYSYPRVQYKSIEPIAVVIGVAEGTETVRQMSEAREVNLAKTLIEVKDAKIYEKDARFGVEHTSQPYTFVTPWLALNQKNYEKYQMLGTWPKRKEMLESILVGNLISISKSLGYTVPAPITARLGKMKEVKTSLKGTPMLGFLGDFSVNFEIPDYWGIGKSVSRGFGTVKRVDMAT